MAARSVSTGRVGGREMRRRRNTRVERSKTASRLVLASPVIRNARKRSPLNNVRSPMEEREPGRCWGGRQDASVDFTYRNYTKERLRKSRWENNRKVQVQHFSLPRRGDRSRDKEWNWAETRHVRERGAKREKIIEKEYEERRWLSELDRRRGGDRISENLPAAKIEQRTEASGSSVLRRDRVRNVSREMSEGKEGKKIQFGFKERFPPLANRGSRADKIEEPKQESSDRGRRKEGTASIVQLHVEGEDDFEEMLNRNRKYFDAAALPFDLELEEDARCRAANVTLDLKQLCDRRSVEEAHVDERLPTSEFSPQDTWAPQNGQTVAEENVKEEEKPKKKRRRIGENPYKQVVANKRVFETYTEELCEKELVQEKGVEANQRKSFGYECEKENEESSKIPGFQEELNVTVSVHSSPEVEVMGDVDTTLEEEGEGEESSCSNSSQQLPLNFNEKEMLGRELEEIAQRRAVTMTKIGKLRKEIQVLQESLSLQKREEASLEEKETELKKRLNEKGSDHLLASSNGDFGGCKQHKA